MSAHETMPAQPRLDHRNDVAGLQSLWDFSPTTPSFSVKMLRIQTLACRSRLRPPHQVIRPVTPRPAWAVYFVFSPDGSLGAHHRFALARLRASGQAIMVVYATRDVSLVPAELTDLADAIHWKGLGGYDFSAYTLALEAIAESSPHADVFVMNDSVYGPFGDLQEVLSRCRWDLTGFTASSDTVNHLQSYAFVLKGVTTERLNQLRPSFPKYVAFDRAVDAIRLQELRFAEIAARHMKVGAFWYSAGGFGQDPTLLKPFELLDAGFPFLKRSLLGKHQRFQARDQVLARMAELGHPLP